MSNNLREQHVNQNNRSMTTTISHARHLLAEFKFDKFIGSMIMSPELQPEWESNEIEPTTATTTSSSLDIIPPQIPNELWLALASRLLPPLDKMTFEQLMSMRSLNLFTLNPVRKSSLINIVLRNRANFICAPFDELAFSKFYRNDNHVLRDEVLLRAKLLVDFKRSFESTQFFMPNSVASLAMPFFFDIFQAEQLQSITSSNALSSLLLLKKSFEPVVQFDESSFVDHTRQNVLWNCFVLFKFRFDIKYRTCFINYFLSLLWLKLDKFASFFMDAMILTGFMSQREIFKLRNELLSEQHLSPSSSSLDNSHAISILDSKLIRMPMSLQCQCRIRIKETLVESPISLDQIDQTSSRRDVQPLPDSLKQFLLYDKEFLSQFNACRAELGLE